ncbi:MAG TPA: sugar kinase [Ruminococcaceae bacterium]|nr:sugar kinase [Oscillospiraceae bacterium]
MKKSEILCIGIACADVLLKGVDFSSGFKDESKPAESVGIDVGGDAANEAIILARLGHDVQLMCGLGKDAVGDLIVNAVRSAGVRTDHAVRSDKSGTAINVIVIHPDGQRNFINSGVPKAAYMIPRIENTGGAEVVSLASFFLPPFTTADICEKTAMAAKQTGAIVCADVVVQPDSELGMLSGALPYVDYFFPNRAEAEQLTGKTALPEIADVFLSMGVKNVIIKTGKEGCYLKNAAAESYIPTYESVKPLDTTGAGDNFAAGFISGILQGKTPEQSARYACGVATVSTQSFGATAGVKSREQVREFIDNIKGE